ncbi:hypothetical protein LCGC14_0895540 [marine sediment metagenome]|uniref:Uncharacterized protein n=1 Tax=marine sediment metagenome TaxID=412755 RepID=A0A0F9RH76_9ZZZZ
MNVDSAEYKKKFIDRLVEKGYKRDMARIEFESWMESSEEAVGDEGDPEWDADECFEYYNS